MADEANRFFTMGQVYDRMAPLLVPRYDFLQDEVLRFLGMHTWDAPLVVDLGAGSGRLLEKILATNASARCCWVDYSEDFLRVARARLERFAARVEFVVLRLEEDWHERLSGAPDLIVSMSAIHHLTSAEKQELYRRCFGLLAPGGWFANIDEMTTIRDDAQRRSLELWVEHVAACRAHVPPVDLPLYDEWKGHFDNWAKRNVDGSRAAKVKGDDLHDPFVAQVQWLQQAGFRRADVLLKYHLWCAIVGQKPDAAGESTAGTRGRWVPPVLG